MEPDGRPAAKFASSLVLLALTAAFAAALVEGGPRPDTGSERRVAERARPAFVEGARRALAEGDLERAAWLDSVVRDLDARIRRSRPEYATTGF